MKHIYALVGVLMTAGTLQADLTSANWISDGYDSFDVILSGTGLGWSGDITSPSGLWDLNSQNVVEFPGPQLDVVYLQNSGVATFLGELPPQYTPVIPGHPYGGPTGIALGTFGTYGPDGYPIEGPIADGANMTVGYLANLGSNINPGPDNPLAWTGFGSISVTSIPDVNDVSTWTWSAEWKAVGGSLEVPEPSVIPLSVLGAAFGLAFRIRTARKVI